MDCNRPARGIRNVARSVPLSPQDRGGPRHPGVAARNVNEGMSFMCLDCGCGKPNDRHGDDRHITMDDLRAAAEASEISVDEAARNIADGARQAQQSGGSAD